MDKLLELRNRIDEIDDEIVKLFLERMEAVQGVAEYKKQVGKPVLDRERELAKLEELKSKVPEDCAEDIEELFEKIMEISKNKQNKIIEE